MATIICTSTCDHTLPTLFERLFGANASIDSDTLFLDSFLAAVPSSMLTTEWVAAEPEDDGSSAVLVEGHVFF